MKINLWLATLCAVILASSSSFAAQAYVSPQRAAAILADGQPWSALAPNGKTFKIVFKKDGTGSIRGPMPFALSITWAVQGDAMCLAGKMGTRCLRFREISGGLQGWDGDKPDLKFSR